MIKIKITNNQINKYDEWTKDESGWRDLSSLITPVREGGFRGNGEITVEEVKSRIESKIKLGEKEGIFNYPPRIEHDQTQNEFRFFVLWKRFETPDDLGDPPQPKAED